MRRMSVTARFFVVRSRVGKKANVMRSAENRSSHHFAVSAARQDEREITVIGLDAMLQLAFLLAFRMANDFFFLSGASLEEQKHEI